MNFSDEEMDTCLSVTQSQALELLQEGIPGWNTYNRICQCLFHIVQDMGLKLPLHSIRVLFCMPHPKMYIFQHENWLSMHGKDATFDISDYEY